jgi:Ni2+-binding GTPase involved in maturation of urease and hydrogenase
MHCHMNVFEPWRLVNLIRNPAYVGSCPHAAIREDISANLHVLEDLQRSFNTEILLIESGGDNLAANYSRELADYIIYVVCVLDLSELIILD